MLGVHMKRKAVRTEDVGCEVLRIAGLWKVIL